MAYPNKLTIGIIGCGVVGGALSTWLQKHTNHELLHYDPAKELLDKVRHADATFICVPVPTNDSGTQNFEILEDAVARAGGVKFIRSTVLPGTNDFYGTYACPEFLTQRTAYKDTAAMDIITGCQDLELMRRIFHEKKVVMMKNVECEIAKYAHNCFGAVKVNFFNLIYNLCEARQADYARVIEGVLMSGYINNEHLSVPGPDGNFGFGGACFPKDLKAFNHFYPTKTFKSCLEENLVHRGTGTSA